jgi:8-oxo-dGTP diphosphatase
MTKSLKIVAKAIIFQHEKVLVLRRSEAERKSRDSHIWDFPGGSIEPEELILDALSREVKEETGLEIKVVAPAYVYDEFQEGDHLVLVKFACDQPVGEIELSEEHDHYLWISLQDLDQADIPEWMKEEIQRAYRVYTEFRG